MCNDKATTTAGSMHNYIVLGINESHNCLKLIQMMSVTSMSNKEIHYEIPIKLGNDLVSYIIPYNIHSFLNQDIDMRNYKGCINNTEYCSKEEFLKLLLDLYAYTNGINTDTDVIERYNNYCKEFWKRHSNCKEISDCEKKQEVKDKQLYKRQPQINKRIKSVRNKKNNDVDRIVKEVINQYTHKQLKEKNNKKSESSPLIPTEDSEDVIEDIKKIGKSGKFIKDWSDEEITLFMRIYKEYGYQKIHDVIPHKWKSPSSMSNCYTTCKCEAIKRHLYPLGLLDTFRKPIPLWSNKDIKQYLGIVSNHDKDENFLLEFSGVDTITECNRKTFMVRKEATKRKLFK